MRDNNNITKDSWILRMSLYYSPSSDKLLFILWVTQHAPRFERYISIVLNPTSVCSTVVVVWKLWTVRKKKKKKNASKSRVVVEPTPPPPTHTNCQNFTFEIIIAPHNFSFLDPMFFSERLFLEYRSR